MAEKTEQRFREFLYQKTKTKTEYGCERIKWQENLYSRNELVKYAADFSEQESKEICICAAINVPGYGIIRGHRHSDCIIAVSSRGYKDLVSQKMQGFVTSKNRFVSRNEGALLQIDAGLKDKSPTRDRDKETLCSEDLY
jgi:hypothetical protein